MQSTEGFSIGLTRARMAIGAIGTLLLCGIAALTFAALVPARASAETLVDDSGGAYQILAPGEAGSIPPSEFSTDESKLYSALTPHEGSVSAGLLAKDFLPEKFRAEGEPALLPACMGKPPAKGTECIEEPEPGALIIRDTTRHTPHLRRNARGRDVRLRAWSRRKDRSPAALPGPRPRLCRGAQPTRV